MDLQASVGGILSRLRATYPQGFAIALHIRFTAPSFLFQAYDEAWIDAYSREGMVLHDPTVRWGFAQAETATIRWPDLPRDDEGAAVMARAQEFGLVHGFTVAVITPEGRSVASFSRKDRPATAEEIIAARQDVEALHLLTAKADALPASVQDTLKQLSIYLTRG